jgi:hypothetical protein
MMLTVAGQNIAIAHGPEAREIMDDLAGNHNTRQRWECRHASDGGLQFTLPDASRHCGIRPISNHGNVEEIIGEFGRACQLAVPSTKSTRCCMRIESKG